MEDYTKHVVDERKFDQPGSSLGHSSDFTLQKSTGEVVEGADAAWKAVLEIYAPFSIFVHDPSFVINWETENGWTMVGVASLWWSLAAPPSGGESKVKGHGGEEWDGVTPAAFIFEHVKDDSDIKLARTEIYIGKHASPAAYLEREVTRTIRRFECGHGQDAQARHVEARTVDGLSAFVKHLEVKQLSVSSSKFVSSMLPHRT